MIEEGFVRLYAQDFATLAARAEGGSDVEPQLTRRVREARSHATMMDDRKGAGHLAAVVERLEHEAGRRDVRVGRGDSDIEAAIGRRRDFLLRVAGLLRTAPHEPRPTLAVRPQAPPPPAARLDVPGRRGRPRRA